MKPTLRAALFTILLSACGGTPPPVTAYPHGSRIELFEGPVHLGDDAAGGQAFSTGRARAARICSLVNMPETADVYLQVNEVRQTETLTNLLLVNGRPKPLPVTLEPDPNGLASNAMSASPVEQVQLEQGPSEICLVAGQKTNGDIDDYEVAGVSLFVEAVDPHEVGVRRGLTQGAPTPPVPPSVAWGERQHWPSPVSAPTPWGANR